MNSYKLGNLGTFYKGAGIPRDDAGSGELPAIRYGELSTSYDTFILKNTRSKISERVAKGAFELEYGDILLAGSGETPEDIGKSAVFLLKKGYAGGDIIVFRPDKTIVDPKFLALYFETESWKKQRRRAAQGQSVVHIHATDLKKMTVRLPDLETQQKIVAVLDSIASQTALLSNNITNQKQLLRFMIGSSFNTSCSSYRKLNEVAKIERGKTLTEDKANDGRYPVVAGGINSPYSHDDYTHEDVITVSASGANAGYVAYRQGKIWASDCSVVYGKDGVMDTHFIYYYLLYQQRKIYQMQTGGAQPHVHCSDLARLKMPFWSIEEQKKIVTRLKAQEELIDTLEMSKQRKSSLYKYLLNHLINGDLDLSKIQLEEKDKSC